MGGGVSGSSFSKRYASPLCCTSRPTRPSRPWPLLSYMTDPDSSMSHIAIVWLADAVAAPAVPASMAEAASVTIPKCRLPMVHPRWPLFTNNDVLMLTVPMVAVCRSNQEEPDGLARWAYRADGSVGRAGSG